MPLNALNVKERAESHFQYKVFTMEKCFNWPYERGSAHTKMGILLKHEGHEDTLRFMESIKA